MFSIFHIENRQDDDFNQLPTRQEMSGAALYWNMVATALGNVVGGHHEETENRRIAALRRNAEHYEAQRKPSVLAEIAAEAFDIVRNAAESLVPTKAKPTAKDAARDWLVATLAGQLGGRLPSKQVEAMAALEKISPRTLRRAAKAAGIRHVRNRDKSWSYALIQAKAAAGRKA